MLTIRQAIKDLLLEQPFSALEISQRLSIAEKEVLEHLTHVARAPGSGSHFQVQPSVCNRCGFAFKKRDRLTTPSRCPKCRHQSIRRPRFHITRD